MNFRLHFSTWMLSMLALSCGQSLEPTLFVAASLSDVAAVWQADYAGGFQYHSGASHLLANQIRSGARADLFLAAGPQAITPLLEAGLVARVDSHYLENSMVLVCASRIDAPVALADLRHARFARIAMADPELAPAGAYAREGLQRAGLWDELRPRMIFTGDVRMAAETVRLSTADAALVYATDVASTGAGSVVTLDSLLFPRALYPLVLLAPVTPGKDSLWIYLHSEPARQAARVKGFR